MLNSSKLEIKQGGGRVGTLLISKCVLRGDHSWASLVAQMVKNLPAMQETWVKSLGQEDPLEKEMATQFSILAWGIPQT